jgi:DNA replication licensing factor MCM3
MDSREDQEEFNGNKRTFGDFLNGDARQKYSSKLQDVLDEKTDRFMVNLDDMRAFDHELTQNVLRQPSQYLPAFEERLQEEAEDLSPGSTDPDRPIRIGIEGSFGRHRVSPRSLLSPLLGTLVCVEGIATKISVVHPKVKRTTHYCPATNKMMSREYRDETSLTGLPTGSNYPKKDDEGNLLETEFGLSTYTDHQTLSIQEMPEHAPHGQLPCSVDVILNDDLVDQCKPGDRVRIVGIFRGVSRQAKGATSGVFKTVLVANHVSQIKKTTTGPDIADGISEEDKEAIKAISQRDDIFELLSRSIAPSVFGHEYIKKAVLMQLLGGVEKNLKNGTHLRGDINVLMVGDPSTAKSQMLRYVMNTANLAISTTGRGSSGVGLTAAVTSDPETKERRLEAGAMVCLFVFVVVVVVWMLLFNSLSLSLFSLTHPLKPTGSC